MDSDRPFLEAVRDQPEDELHRLAWADWLEEHGEVDRATFIRAQLAAARLDESDLARDALEDCVDDLLARHETAWAGRVAELALDWEWSRGCLERITIWADILLNHGDELFESAPIRNIRLLGSEEDLARLAGCPWLSSVEFLEISTGVRVGSLFASPYFRDRALQELFVSPHLTRLTGLDLRGQGLESPLLQTLLDRGILGRLEYLDLSGNQALGDRALRVVTEALKPKLRHLGIQGTNITPAGLQSLLHSTRMPSLEVLDVNFGLLFRRGGLGGISPSRLDNELLQLPVVERLQRFSLADIPLTSAILETLVVSPSAPHLRELILTQCGLSGDSEIRILATAESLSGLRRLELGGNVLRDRGAKALASSPYLTSLTRLGLIANDIGGPGIRALIDSPILDRLCSLDLSGNHVGLPNVIAMSRTARPRRLTHLRLANANLDGECASILVESPTFARLRSLGLENNVLGDEGIKALASGRQLSRLRTLGLDGTEVNSIGANALLESSQLTSLRQLSMRNSYISSGERDRLRARFGPATRF